MATLSSLHFTLDAFQSEGDWWYRIGNGTTQKVGKAPSRGSALRAGYDELMVMIKAMTNLWS